MAAPNLSRRTFLASAAAGAGTFLLPGGIRAAFASTAAPGDILVCLFQRGGADGVATVVPYREPAYLVHRPRVGVPPHAVLDLDGTFGLHPAMWPLARHFQAGRLSFVHATGSTVINRSHFQAQAMAETGSTDGAGAVGSTWIRRHLDAIGADVPFSAVATSEALPAGASPTEPSPLAIASLDYFGLGTAGWGSGERYVTALRQAYAAEPTTLGPAAGTVLGAVDIARAIPNPYWPHNGAWYGTTPVGKSLSLIAQLVRAGVGLQAATVDVGGWDLHAHAGGVQGPMASRLAELSFALDAFLTDLDDQLGRVCVVVITEFGRRLSENGSGGFDHGHGGVLWLAGGGIAGGRVHGDWPGLPAALGTDLPVTTDVRTVLGELCERRLGSGGGVFGDVGPYLGVTR